MLGGLSPKGAGSAVLGINSRGVFVIYQERTMGSGFIINIISITIWISQAHPGPLPRHHSIRRPTAFGLRILPPEWRSRLGRKSHGSTPSGTVSPCRSTCTHVGSRFVGIRTSAVTLTVTLTGSKTCPVDTSTSPLTHVGAAHPAVSRNGRAISKLRSGTTPPCSSGDEAASGARKLRLENPVP